MRLVGAWRLKKKQKKKKKKKKKEHTDASSMNVATLFIPYLAASCAPT